MGEVVEIGEVGEMVEVVKVVEVGEIFRRISAHYVEGRKMKITLCCYVVKLVS